MQDEPVTIVDREVLKVLSTETRMDILKILSEGKRNPSFVAKKLGKSDATIVEHMKVMEKAGLVKKLEAPGKKWVFYSLTERGRGIVSSKSRRLVIILSTSLVGVIAGAGMLGGYMHAAYKAGTFAVGPLAQRAAEGADVLTGAGEAAPAVAEGAGAAIAQSQALPLLYAGAAVLVISIAGVGFYFYKRSKLNGGRMV